MQDNVRTSSQGCSDFLNEVPQHDSLLVDAVQARPHSPELQDQIDTSQAERCVGEARQGGDKTVDVQTTESLPVIDRSEWLSTVLVPETPESRLKAEVETLEERCKAKELEHATIVAELKKKHEIELKAALDTLETFTWKKTLAENRLKVVVEEKEALESEHQALVEKEKGAEALIQPKEDCVQETSWTRQVLQERYDDLQAKKNTKCKKVP